MRTNFLFFFFFFSRVTFLGSQKMANFRADEDAVLVQVIFI